MKTLIIRSVVIGCAMSLAMGAMPAAVFAHNGVEHGTEVEAERHQLVEDNSMHTIAASTRLEKAKLAICKARQNKISGIMTRSISRAQNQIKLFGITGDRVQAFYAKNGKTLADYPDLVAAVATAKAQANANLATLKANTFSCTSDDPKGEAAAFKISLETLTTSLKDYRSAVKDLIKAAREDT